jgi:hypothetical protein
LHFFRKCNFLRIPWYTNRGITNSFCILWASIIKSNMKSKSTFSSNIYIRNWNGIHITMQKRLRSPSKSVWVDHYFRPPLVLEHKSQINFSNRNKLFAIIYIITINIIFCGMVQRNLLVFQLKILFYPKPCTSMSSL